MRENGVILIVDDQAALVLLMEKILSTAGYKVLKAYNGDEAIKVAHESMPDLILLDVMMPGMTGYEVTKTLRQDPPTSSISIVLLTALDSTKDKVKGLEAGADDFLTKPVNVQELLARVRSMIKLKRLQEKYVNYTKPIIPGGVSDQDVSISERKAVVLVVDGDRKTAQYYRNVIESGGIAVITVYDIREALAVLDEVHPDLILLDLLPPDMNENEVLDRIQAVSEQDIPVFILSCVEDIDTKVKLIENGVEDYLVKPVRSAELLVRIKAALRKVNIRNTLRSNMNKLYEESIQDSLTKLYNKHYLKTVIDEKIAFSRRYKRPFSVIMIDIDRFKCINDVFGHLAGDSVLEELAVILRKTVRASDVVARFGGEEFVIVLPEIGLGEAFIVAEKLRVAVENFRFREIGDRSVTVSMGVTAWTDEDTKMSVIMKRADNALYEAKDAGRNCVKVRSRMAGLSTISGVS